MIVRKKGWNRKMKNLKYFSFERNKYFYGKLLSVNDFKTEQRYMNDKRRLVNRFVNGCGVVCGMNVIAIDDATISVERGIALDFVGREIVIDTPVTKKLSMIDGFEDYTAWDNDIDELFLCVRYDEQQMEAVHSITGTQKSDTEDVEYNKYKEGYSLYLIDKEPENSLSVIDGYYKDIKTIYKGNGFKITQEIPRYVMSNEECEIRITLEKEGQNKNISFSYELESSCLKGEKGDSIVVNFDEELQEKSSKYVIVKKVRTMPVIDVLDKVSIVPGSFKMTIGKKKVVEEVFHETIVQISQKEIRQQIIDNYYQDIMNSVVLNSSEQHIYLARLSIVKAGTTYIINNVESMPYNQYLMNNTLNTIIRHMEYDYPQSIGEKTGYIKDMSTKVSMANDGEQLISTGEVIIDMGIGGSAGQRFYSKEISHGLGLGNVVISLGVSYSPKENSTVVYGNQDIFADKECKVKLDMAARVDPETGKFIVGIKCLETTDERQVKIQWMAVKDKQEIVREKVKKTMNIKPDMLNLGTKEKHCYEAIVDGENESRIRWRVKEENGGTIDENGMYTAPNVQGVFEIIAESMDNPGMKASTFVVVRETRR